MRQTRITFIICAAFSYAVKLFNLAKSELVHVGAVDDVGGLARILGCKVSSLPMKYLGLPSRAYFKPKSIWDGIIEKMERCLAGCKLKRW